MKKLIKKIMPVVIMCILTLSLIGCTNEKTYIDFASDFNTEMKPYLISFIKDVSKNANVQNPAKIENSFETLSLQELKEFPHDFDKYLNDEEFYFEIKLYKDGTYSKDEINSILKEIKARNITMNVSFDSDKYTVYEIRTEGITVDEKKPWGDAEIHKVYEYVIY